MFKFFRSFEHNDHISSGRFVRDVCKPGRDMSIREFIEFFTIHQSAPASVPILTGRNVLSGDCTHSTDISAYDAHNSYLEDRLAAANAAASGFAKAVEKAEREAQASQSPETVNEVSSNI